jgi:GNAT superfamily N-acetyltransferase
LKEIIDNVKRFQYTSLKYAEFDDISNSVICINNDESIFLYSIVGDKVTIDWAASSMKSFFDGLEETIGIISQDQTIKQIDIEFIPEHYVSKMEELGFITTSEWIDFWNNSLETLYVEQPNSVIIRRIRENEYQVASEITKSCRDCSRGYKGETSEWIKEWNESENSCIFVAEKIDEIIGICCVSLYGFDSEKGVILWIREVAVKPSYHSQKIGLNLVAFAINWGKSNDALRSFLACDVKNRKAN